MKQRSLILFTILSAIILFNGCIVTSLNPLYTEEDAIFDTALVGTWSDGDGELWTFRQGESKENEEPDNYELYIYDEKSSGKFEVHLVELGGYRFLDVFPAGPEDDITMYSLHTIPVHSFLKIAIEEDILKIAFLDLEWLSNKIKEGNAGIDYVTDQDGERLCLTAKTPELKAFILKHAANKEAFEFEDGMERFNK